MNDLKHAHMRLLNAVIYFRASDQFGSKAEVREAAIELESSMRESQQILYPELLSDYPAVKI